MQQQCSKYFTLRPYLTLGMGSIGHTKTFLEDGHVACQIKELTECSSMVANILPDPGDWVNRSKFNFFITCCILNKRVYILPADPSLTLLFGSIGKN